MTSAVEAQARLNDGLRAAGPTQNWHFSLGVENEGPAFIQAFIEAIVAYDDFGPKEDWYTPYNTHDHGTVWPDGTKVLWQTRTSPTGI